MWSDMRPPRGNMVRKVWEAAYKNALVDHCVLSGADRGLMAASFRDVADLASDDSHHALSRYLRHEPVVAPSKSIGSIVEVLARCASDAASDLARGDPHGASQIAHEAMSSGVVGAAMECLVLCLHEEGRAPTLKRPSSPPIPPSPRRPPPPPPSPANSAAAKPDSGKHSETAGDVHQSCGTSTTETKAAVSILRSILSLLETCNSAAAAPPSARQCLGANVINAMPPSSTSQMGVEGSSSAAASAGAVAAMCRMALRSPATRFVTLTLASRFCDLLQSLQVGEMDLPRTIASDED